MEGYLLTPLVQRYTVDLPPVFTIVGYRIARRCPGRTRPVVLAAPITIVGAILVKMLYIEDMLGEIRSESPPIEGSQ